MLDTLQRSMTAAFTFEGYASHRMTTNEGQPRRVKLRLHYTVIYEYGKWSSCLFAAYAFMYIEKS